MSVILGTPTIPAREGVFTVYGSSVIEGSTDAIYSKLLDLSSYGSWNTFSPKVELQKQATEGVLSVGDDLILHAHISCTSS